MPPSPKTNATKFNFSNALLSWFDLHGRKNLPWQQPIEPYRVWLSEIMLQQTQVETVIPYFLNFINTYPNIQSLAKAKQDDVLHLWTGLGYYARARNLHACAQQVVSQFNGKFPNDIDDLKSLPGIGPSTAAAIASIAFGKPTAILDGNVKRVLTRFYAEEEWPGKTTVQNRLWAHADSLMPQKRCRDYTQAIMDLGATLCKRSKPNCTQCPMRSHCKAYELGTPTAYPARKPAKTKPTKHLQMLIIKNNEGHIFLEQRPPQGIWGGLWSLPELDSKQNPASYCLEHFGQTVEHHRLEEITHVFSHYTLKIQAHVFQLKSSTKDKLATIAEARPNLWFTPSSPQKIGLAAPVKKMLQQYE